MSYADRNTGGSRVIAIVLVAIIVAGMGLRLRHGPRAINISRSRRRS